MKSIKQDSWKQSGPLQNCVDYLICNIEDNDTTYQVLAKSEKTHLIKKELCNQSFSDTPHF